MVLHKYTKKHNINTFASLKPNKLLFPLAWVYNAITSIRNVLFNTGLIASESFAIPVICVGNLNTGGTGKTPHVEYLVSMLKDRLFLAVLSRGYKRASHGMVVAGAGSASEQIGDEPLMMHHKFPGVIVAVAENRRDAIRRLIDMNPLLECVLMDDGFQHRSVKPRLTMLLTSYHSPFTRDRVLPAGSLRESKSNYKRADVVVITKCPDDLTPVMRAKIRDEIRPVPGQLLLFSTIQYMPLRQATSSPHETGDLAGCRVLGFSGLASNADFIQYLDSYFPGYEHVSYGDHHIYQDEDLQHLVAKFNTIDAGRKIMVTTEKDYVKIIGHKALAGMPLFYVPIHISFSDHDHKALKEKIQSVCLT